METITEDNKKLSTTNKVVPFGAKPKSVQKTKKPPKIDWAASTSEESEYNRAVFVIDGHSDHALNLLAAYFKQNEIIDPQKLTAEQFKDLVLIKEAIKSLMLRVVGYPHELQEFIEHNMKIPLPTDDE